MNLKVTPNVFCQVYKGTNDSTMVQMTYHWGYYSTDYTFINTGEYSTFCPEIQLCICSDHKVYLVLWYLFWVDNLFTSAYAMYLTLFVDRAKQPTKTIYKNHTNMYVSERVSGHVSFISFIFYIFISKPQLMKRC